MWYWIVMIMLAIGSIIMLAVSFAGIKRRNDMAVNVRPQGRGYGDDELSRRPRKEAAKESQDRPAKKSEDSGKSYWKILTVGINILLLFMIPSGSGEETTVACTRNICRS